jgi:hypothetical protein
VLAGASRVAEGSRVDHEDRKEGGGVMTGRKETGKEDPLRSGALGVERSDGEQWESRRVGRTISWELDDLLEHALMPLVHGDESMCSGGDVVRE